MAARSAASAKAQMPDVDTVLLTDLECIDGPFDAEGTGASTHPMAVQLPPLTRLPLEYRSAIYLDADTRACAPLYDVFELVEDFRTDIALVRTSGKRRLDRNFPYPGVPEAYSFWRSTLVAFENNPTVQEFLETWKTVYEERRKRYAELNKWKYHPDQGAMRETLYRSGLSVTTLPQKYCCNCGDVVLRGTVRVVHAKGNLSRLAVEANRHAPHLRLFIKGASKRL